MSSSRSRAGAPVQDWLPTRWALWRISPQLVGSVLIVEITCVALAGIALLAVPDMLAGMPLVLLLAALGIAHGEIARNIERVRWRIGDDLHIDLSSVWVFAAAVLLLPGHAVLVTVIVHAYMSQRTSGRRTPPYRHVFSTATMVLACLSASAVMHGGTVGEPVVSGSGLDVLVLTLGILVFLTVNTALVAGAIAMSTPQARISDAIGEWDENLLEIATLCLGAVTAAAMTVNVWLVLFVFPPLLVLHRAVLVRHLEVAATTDSKTGLLNAAAWHTQAERELRRGGRRQGPKAVLVVDLDRFKAVNDTHGHLAGDHVLAAVADAMRAEVRDRDLVGRFGGEEFVVLLGGLAGPGQGQAELEAVAERIRRRIAALRVEMPTADGPLTIAGLSASVGGSLYPGDGADLRTLLQVADTALYAAKRAGRNLVRMGIHLPVPAEIDQEAADSTR
jgi:diguanylate cyclase (GGDEF)-like protein